MNDELAIQVSKVSKNFKLPHEKNSSIKSAVVNFYRRNKSYETQNVLNEVSFDIKKGEFFGIVGRNGSGKSTMLKMLAGIYNPTAGSITVNGKLTPFIELGVGFNPELTGRENVFLNGALLGFNRAEMLAMYDDIVAFAEIEKFMDQKLKNYSSGMQVRLAFSIAIRAQSDILLIDEVLAVGDSNFQTKCLAVFEEIKTRGTTVIFVSHDMESVRRFCDRAVLIEKGELLKSGETQVVIDEYLALNAEPRTTKGSPFGVTNVTNKTKDVLKITATRALNADFKQAARMSTDHYYFEVDLEFLSDCNDSVPGVVLRNQSGIRVTASNTTWAGIKPRDFKKGEKATYRFKFENVLERGTYFLSSNVVSKKTDEFYDWDNDAVSFLVDTRPASGGVINPEYEIMVEVKS